MKNRMVQAMAAVLAAANLSVSAFPYQSTYQSTKNGVTVTLVDYMLKPDPAVLTMPQALWGMLPGRSIKASQLSSLGIRPVEITVSSDKDVIIRAENMAYPQVTATDVQGRVSKALVSSVLGKAVSYFGIWFGIELGSRFIAHPDLIRNYYRDMILGCKHLNLPEKNVGLTRDMRKSFLRINAIRLIVASIAAYMVCKTERNAIHQAVTSATITARAVSGGNGQQDFYLYIDNGKFADKKITMIVQDLHTNDTVADFEFVLN